jgi:hypothetical protein
MKTAVAKFFLTIICFIGIVVSINAQSSCYFYLRDANPPPNSYQVSIAVWDNALGIWLSPPPQGPWACYADQYNTVYTSVVITPDTTPRYRIVIQVDKLTAPTSTQYRQSALLTSAQYLAGNVFMNPITF